jgi:hypothetical protein
MGKTEAEWQITIDVSVGAPIGDLLDMIRDTRDDLERAGVAAAVDDAWSSGGMVNVRFTAVREKVTPDGDGS